MSNAPNGGIVNPDWALPLLGERELRICRARDAQVLCSDKDGQRLPAYQRMVESEELGEHYVLDSKHRMICG